MGKSWARKEFGGVWGNFRTGKLATEQGEHEARNAQECDIPGKKEAKKKKKKVMRAAESLVSVKRKTVGGSSINW